MIVLSNHFFLSKTVCPNVIFTSIILFEFFSLWDENFSSIFLKYNWNPTKNGEGEFSSFLLNFGKLSTIKKYLLTRSKLLITNVMGIWSSKLKNSGKIYSREIVIFGNSAVKMKGFEKKLFRKFSIQESSFRKLNQNQNSWFFFQIEYYLQFFVASGLKFLELLRGGEERG